MSQEAIKPSYYQMQIGETQFDVFDLVRAIQERRNFSFEEASALKYLVRLKEDTVEKRINDLEKAKECLDREILYLQKNKKPKINIVKVFESDNSIFVCGFEDYLFVTHLTHDNLGFIVDIKSMRLPKVAYIYFDECNRMCLTNELQKAYITKDTHEAQGLIISYLKREFPDEGFTY